MKKRMFSAILAALFIFPLFMLSPQAAEKTVTIAWNEPAIPGDAGQKITLTQFNLGVSATRTIPAAAVAWKNGGAAITSFTPPEPGVYPLTAEYDGGAKTVYVVAKKSADTSYVLYENDFSAADAIADWDKQVDSSALFKIEDSKLVIDARNYDTLRIFLPEWLGAFGNYRIDASVSSSHEKDTGRWNSIMYRIQNNSYPYYQMCVRKNTTAVNGIEFAIRTPANSWLVVTTGPYTQNQVTGTYYDYCVRAKNDIIMETFNGRDIIYNNDKKDYMAGRIGLQANYSIMYVDKITVSLQLDNPDFNISPTLIETTAEVENIQNALTNVAEITSPASFDHLENAMSAILYVDGDNIVTPGGEVIAPLASAFDKIGPFVIPLFYCKAKTDVVGVRTLLATREIPDAAIISDDPAIVKYARNLAKNLRGVIDFRGKYAHELTDAEISEVRLAVNSSLAKTALLDVSALSQRCVSELRELLITVWAYGECKTKEDAAALIVNGAHGIVSPNPDNVKAAYALFEPNTLTSTPLVIGHRGNPTNAPENSMSSYRIAYENGADIVETDVYLTTDNEVVIMHDADIARTTDGAGNIESMTLAQLKTYHLWGDNDAYKSRFPDERVPTLKELVNYAKGKDLKIFIEIKSGKPLICKFIADIVKEADMVDQVCVIAFSITQCWEMQRYAPAISCGYLVGSTAQASTQRMANAALYTFFPAILANNTTLNPAHPAITKMLCRVANDRGVTIWPWTYTISTSTQFSNAFMWGYGGLTTNDAQYTKNTVKFINTDLDDLFLLPSSVHDYTVSANTFGRVVSDITAKAEVTVLSGDSVTVSKGKITAVKEGDTRVMLRYTTKLPNNMSYTLYTKAVTISVRKPGEFGKITPADYDRYYLKGALVAGISPDTKAESLAAHFKNTELKLKKGDSPMAPGDTVGTGCILESFAGGTLVETRTLAVTGDLNGNGQIDTLDYIKLRLLILGIGAHSEAQRAAGDVNKSGTINVTDYILIRLNILGFTTID